MTKFVSKAIFALATSVSLLSAAAAVADKEDKAEPSEAAPAQSKIFASWYASDGSGNELYIADKKYKISIYGSSSISKWKQECTKEKTGLYSCQGGIADSSGAEYDIISSVSLSEDGTTLVETWKMLRGAESKANGKTIYKRKANVTPVR